jgi:hypothetical protein
LTGWATEFIAEAPQETPPFAIFTHPQLSQACCSYTLPTSDNVASCVSHLHRTQHQMGRWNRGGPVRDRQASLGYRALEFRRVWEANQAIGNDIAAIVEASAERIGGRAAPQRVIRSG